MSILRHAGLDPASTFFLDLKAEADGSRIKSGMTIQPVDLPLGLLMNFGAATFREGVKRVANNRSS